MHYSPVATPKYFYDNYLSRYTLLYYLLGVIEYELRRRIPYALSTYSELGNGPYWWSVLPESFENRRSIERALKKSGGSAAVMTDFLPFGFWRHMFIGANYKSLWLNSLNKVFLNLKNPNSKSSFDRVCNSIYRAYKLRNKIAHFDISGNFNYESEKRNLIYLIKVLG